MYAQKANLNEASSLKLIIVAETSRTAQNIKYDTALILLSTWLLFDPLFTLSPALPISWYTVIDILLAIS